MTAEQQHDKPGRGGRLNSMAEYTRQCPATALQKPHDWRHATDAPGWKLGDDCVRCEACQLKAISTRAA